MIDFLQSIGISVALFCIVYAYVKYSKIEERIKESLNESVKNVAVSMREHIDTELEPVHNAVSRAMTRKSSAGVDVRQVKTLERKIALDSINMQDPMIQAALKAFPNAAEYVKKNPELITELLPRLQRLGGVEGFKIEDLFNPSPSAQTRQPHPFGFREE